MALTPYLFQFNVNAIRFSLDGQQVYGFLFSNFDFTLVHIRLGLLIHPQSNKRQKDADKLRQ